MQDLENIRKEELEGLVYTNPLALLFLRKENEIKFVNEFLPYSTGFEIECDKKKEYRKTNFNHIPYILDVDIDESEQRYRISNGINGILCLYFICYQLKINSALNPGSGIHYHVDFTDLYDLEMQKLDPTGLLKDNENWILDELDSWGYKGKYNSRKAGSWFRFNALKTIEFRCGEMSFDYEELIKRIIHANKIVETLKNQLNTQKPTYQEFRKEIFTSYIKENYKQRIKLTDIQKNMVLAVSPETIIKSRVIKI